MSRDGIKVTQCIMQIKLFKHETIKGGESSSQFQWFTKAKIKL